MIKNAMTVLGCLLALVVVLAPFILPIIFAFMFSPWWLLSAFLTVPITYGILMCLGDSE